MITLDRFEPVPLQFKFYSLIINKPSFCYITKVKNQKIPILYPKLGIFKQRPEFIVINQPFKVTNLRWIRHVVDSPEGNLMTMVFTLGNLRSRKISYRLWGDYMGQIFDITPYFRQYYYQHIPSQIPPVDINEKSFYEGIH